MAKIFIKARAKDLAEILSKLEMCDNFSTNAEYTVDVEITQVAENYNYLCKSDKIIEWGFIEEPTPGQDIEEKPKDEPKKDEGEEKSLIEQLRDSIKGIISCKSFPEYELVKLAWMIKRQSPNLRFTKDLFTYFGGSKIYDSSFTVKDVVLGKLVKSYYSNTKLDDSSVDILSKIKDYWKGLEKFESMDKVIESMFGFTDKNK